MNQVMDEAAELVEVGNTVLEALSNSDHEYILDEEAACYADLGGDLSVKLRYVNHGKLYVVTITPG